MVERGAARHLLLPCRHDQGRPAVVTTRARRSRRRRERTEGVNQKLEKLKPDLILVAHGAAMETPEEAQFMLDHTSCEGIWTGSSTERLPIERAVSEEARKFAALRFSNP